MVFYLVDNIFTKTRLEFILKILHPKINQKRTGKPAVEIFLNNIHFRSGSPDIQAFRGTDLGLARTCLFDGCFFY